MTRLTALALVLATTGLAAAEVVKEPTPPLQQPPKPTAGAPGGNAVGAAPAFAPRRRPPTPPPPPVVSTPAPEIAALGKQLAGTYTCKGVSLRGDGSSTPLEAKVTIALDLDNAWIRASLVEKTGIKFDEYRTYDSIAQQWTRIQMASSSGHVVTTSLGEKNGKWTWEGTESSPNGTMQVRDFEQRDGKGLKVWGEAMMSGSWQKTYEATCKR